jgi:hypothetical protein
MIVNSKPEPEAAADSFSFRMTGEVIVKVWRWDDYLERMVETDEERRVYLDGIANTMGTAAETNGVPRACSVECRGAASSLLI